MSKTWRRNDRFRPKKDRAGKKSRKQREFEDDKQHRPHGEGFDRSKVDIDDYIGSLEEE